MNFLSLIESKREGKTHAPEDIREFVHAFTAGKIPDYQMGALLMAIYFRGLDTVETTALTLAKQDSACHRSHPVISWSAGSSLLHRPYGKMLEIAETLLFQTLKRRERHAPKPAKPSCNFFPNHDVGKGHA
jgi:hypothetical protein